MLKVDVIQGDIAQAQADCLVVNLFAGVTAPGGATGAVDAALGGAISQVIASGDFTGEAGTSLLLYAGGKIPADRVLVLGLGAAEKFDLRAARRAGGEAYQAAAKLKGVQHVAAIVHGAGIGGLDPQAAAQAVVEGALLAAYPVKQYPAKDASGPTRCTLVEFDPDKLAAVEAGAAAGIALAQGVYSARDYVNEPPNVLTPVVFADLARKMADEVGLSCTLLGEAEMADLGMGMILGVSQGSANEAQFIILDHAPPGRAEEPPLIFVGKGITFDTGGISIKPSENMWRMKNDMGGAAAVIGAMQAIARLGVPRRVIGIAVCVENMPDGLAYRPGDILTGITGKTAEIISTDAEGRLVLADALGYVARFNPAAVVDLATLTGAVGIALGDQAAGLFANHDGLRDGLLAAATASNERLWPMPLWDEYKESIKSDMAQVKNSGGRMGGLSTSAKFLEHFTEGYPWAHLDIASMVTSDNVSALGPKGATGYGVRLLTAFAQSFTVLS